MSTLSKPDVERLFAEAADGSLLAADSALLQAALDGDAALKARYQQYTRAVALLRRQPRAHAPDALASTILRRTRRRRSMVRTLRLHEINFSRFPVEVVIPLLLAAAVALFLMTASP